MDFDIDKDLTLPKDNLDSARLLAPWEWAVPGAKKVLMVTLFGDLFVEDSEGMVAFLDTVEGSVEGLTYTPEEFFDELEMFAEEMNWWFKPELVEQLKTKGVTLGPDQCYGFKVHPLDGGKVDTKNVEVKDLYAYLAKAGKRAQEKGPGTDEEDEE